MPPTDEGLDALTDKFGFLDPSAVESTCNFRELVNVGVTLVLAPPWTGKTFFCKQLYAYLMGRSQTAGAQEPRAEHVWLTSFENASSGNSPLPDSWVPWQAGDESAVWIVDAIDEDVGHGRNQVTVVLDALDALDATQKTRLSLVVTCRRNEVPPWVEERLRTTCPDSAELRTFIMAPIDAHEARLICGPKEELARVRQIISDHALGAIGGLPCVLGVLRSMANPTKLSTTDAWKRVLEKLLDAGCDANAGRSPRITDRFDATARIAAILTLSEYREIAATATPSDGLRVDRVVLPTNQKFDRLTDAADDALASNVFRRTATGYTFAARHVQEWFAAFALADVPLTKLRPLLTDKDGKPQPSLQSVCSLIAEVTQFDDVRDWISELYGGVPPHSDASPWTLDKSLRVLDRLQAIAKDSPDGFRVHNERALDRLAVAGLGTELARRLDTPDLTLGEKVLLIDVASGTGASETAPQLCAIVLDSHEDERVRSRAAYALFVFGADCDVSAIERFVPTLTPTSRESRVLKSVLIRLLFRHKIWDFDKCLENAPIPETGYGDATWSLEYELRTSMTIENARDLLGKFDWSALSGSAKPANNDEHVHRKSHGPISFVRHAIELVLTEGGQTDSDLHLLKLVVLADDPGYYFAEEQSKIERLLATNMEVRRQTFEEGRRRYPAGPPNSCYHWRFVLTPDDVGWLTDILEAETATPVWLWDFLLSMIYARDVSQGQRNRVRRLVRERCPDHLVSFDRQRKKSLKLGCKFESERKRHEKRELDSQVTILNIVTQTLEYNDCEELARLHRLSWVCFSDEHMRPTNLVGEWDDLPPKTQHDVTVACSRELVACTPTSVPDTPTFPGSILFEGAAFCHAIKHPDEYDLSGEQVRKWLPAAFIFGTHHDADVLARCWSADPSATEDVIYDAIIRDLGLPGDRGHTVLNLPREYWSKRLIARCTPLLDDAALSEGGRCRLLQVFANVAKLIAANCAKEWLGELDWSDSANDHTLAQAIGTLLVAEPEAGIDELERLVKQRGHEALGKIEVLTADRGNVPKTIRHCSVPSIEKLILILHKALPPESDPPEVYGRVVSIDQATELRRLRDGLVFLLIESDDPNAEQAVERVAAKYASVRAWLDRIQAGEQVATVMRAVQSPESDGAHVSRVPLNDLVRVLDDKAYRIIRSSEDLLRVIVEELENIAKTVKHDLSMLYRPHVTGKTREHLHEEALSAYLRRRLEDRIPGRSLGLETKVFLGRETLTTVNQRLDIRVDSPTVDGGTATVVIEVKWGDNRGVATALEKQLGDRYLVGGNLTCGIYVVGWCEKATWSRKPPNPQNSITAWRTALEEQANEFQRRHPAVTITPIIFDLCWSALRASLCAET